MGMTTDMGIRPGMHTFSMTAGLGDIGTGRARQMEAVEKAKGKMKGVARKTGFRLSAGMYTSMGMRLPGQTSIALLLMGTGSRESGLMTRAGRMQAGMSWRKGERRKGVLPAPLRGRRKSMHLVLLRERRKSVLPLPLRSQKKQKNAQPTQIRWTGKSGS